MQNQFQFDGKGREFIWIGVTNAILFLCTLGLAYPWVITNVWRWKTRHTIIEGRRLKFSGSGSGLFGKWVKWWFLSLVTLGLYQLVIWPRMQKWLTEKTAFAEEQAVQPKQIPAA